jgi:hypothetical protein
MAVLVVECNPRLLGINEEMYPDRDVGFIYDHLKHYCSRFSPLPAATIMLCDGSPVVVQGHKYVQIAVDLGRESIRSIVSGSIDSEEVQRFVRSDGVRILDWDALRREERASDVLDAVHVFFFEPALSDVQRALFEERIGGFFQHIRSVLLQGRQRVVSKVTYSHAGHCAEFVATTPAGDRSWFGEFHARCLDFSRNVAGIASYQGRKFVS